MRGTIYKIIYHRGYAFLTDEENDSRFFHASSVIPGGQFEFLRMGQKVEFDPQEHERGPRAVNVRTTK